MRIDKNILLREFEILKDFDILNIYPYGSRVYGTYNDMSDYDFVIIVKDDISKMEIESENKIINLFIFSHDDFIKRIKSHDVISLECIFLSKIDIIEESIDYKKYFNYSTRKLRKSISLKSIQCWEEARDKFEMKNYNVGKKSIFHTIRVLSLGCSIAECEGDIDTLPYGEVNHLWFDIKSDVSTDWNHYKNKWRMPIYRRLLLEFISLAPKI